MYLLYREGYDPEGWVGAWEHCDPEQARLSKE
jgi:hypothetical protein